MMEGSGSRSGSMQNNDVSGSVRSKNIQILRMRIRIHNTARDANINVVTVIKPHTHAWVAIPSFPWNPPR
jgi:hypothetical protein